MISTALLVRLALHGLIAGLGLLLGASIRFVESASGGVAALLGLLAAGVAASAVAETCYARRRPAAPRDWYAGEARDSQAQRPARYDALTGLPDRHAFLKRLHDLTGGRRRGDRHNAVLILDLVGFKAINKALGCAAGDLLLRHTSARLLAALRETDTLARLGADEFAVIQSDIKHPAGAVTLCKRLLQSLEEPFDLFGHLVTVGARIGIALHPDDGEDPKALLEHARIALLRAKADPKDGFRYYQAAMDAQLRERKALESDLTHALAHAQFELDYQPQIDIASRRMVGVEALLRWNHPARGRVGPDHFIPLAEDSGSIVPIGAWVLEQACAQAVRWHQAGAPTLRMSVNMSPVQFRQPDLVRTIHEILGRTGLTAQCLELEVTERVLMQDTEANLETLREIRSMGVRIAIDDFGIGHSSLGYLRRFPFDEIKVDRSFVGALEHDPSAAAIVGATLSLGRQLGLVSVAEGVESARQLNLLGAQGCCLAQGFYFSPPVHAHEVDAMIQAAAMSSHDVQHHGLPRAV